MTSILRRLRTDCTGTSAMEFALVAPMFIILMLGTLQIGLWMHGYNGMRAVAAETSRHFTVQNQRGTPGITNLTMARWARDEARNSSYILAGGTVTTDVTDNATQNITGVTQKTLTVTYQMSSFMGMVGISSLNLTFRRPIFVKA